MRLVIFVLNLCISYIDYQEKITSYILCNWQDWGKILSLFETPLYKFKSILFLNEYILRLYQIINIMFTLKATQYIFDPTYKHIARSAIFMRHFKYSIKLNYIYFNKINTFIMCLKHRFRWCSSFVRFQPSFMTTCDFILNINISSYSINLIWFWIILC